MTHVLAVTDVNIGELLVIIALAFEVLTLAEIISCLTLANLLT